MKVEIKERKLTAGNRSLYLEYYETGFRKKENLHLYLVPDDAPNAKVSMNGLTTGHGRYRLNAYSTHRLLKARRSRKKTRGQRR